MSLSHSVMLFYKNNFRIYLGVVSDVYNSKLCKILYIFVELLWKPDGRITRYMYLCKLDLVSLGKKYTGSKLGKHSKEYYCALFQHGNNILV